MRIGVDIGGTKTAAVAVTQAGEIVQRLRLPTVRGDLGVVDTAARAITELAIDLGIEPGEFTSIGVGIPGRVDPETGRVTHAVNLAVEDLEFGAELSARLGMLVRVENDVNAAALGVYQLLADESTHSMAYLNLGTGLAAGLVLDGQLWRGSRGAAGEIGHIPIDPTGPLCPCGQRGCIEVLASGSAVARQWPGADARPVQELFEAAERGETRAIEVRHGLVNNIAAAVRILVLTIDVDTVVLGGGISSLGEELRATVGEVLEEWSAASPFLASLELASRVRLAPTDYPSAAVGAALVGMAGTPSLS
ncbi:MAG TPA: ROK family protein [Homoserinimonas sp.]|nr:ROK family protein [Homoserinimonas sp.]